MAASMNVLKHFECSICFETYSNPKQLACNHQYCKVCLDGMLEFQADKSAVIKCPQRCADVTCIGKDETTNNLRVCYEFKNLLEVMNPPCNVNAESRRRCQYEDNCNREITLSCCGNLMCKHCSVIHKSDQQPHDDKTPVYIEKRDNTLNVLCQEHLTRCTRYCTTDDSFVCEYCTKRAHQTHQIITFEKRSSFIKKTLLSDSLKAENLNASKKITEKEMLACEKTLDAAIRQRKAFWLREYINFLDDEGLAIKECFKHEYTKHIQKYPTPRDSEYYSNHLKKDSVDLILQYAQTKLTNSNIKNITLTLTDDYAFRDTHPFGRLYVKNNEKRHETKRGKLNVVQSEDAVSPRSTFNSEIGNVLNLLNILSKLRLIVHVQENRGNMNYK